MRLTAATRQWLLEAPEPYIKYQALRLLRPEDADPGILNDDPFVQENLALISQWSDEVLTRHDKPGLFMHRLAMLADLGVTAETTGVAPIAAELLSNFTGEGAFPIGISIAKAFGGSGETSREWILCDLPVTIYALLRMGVSDARLDRGVTKLVELAGESYYPCCGSIPKFKGPGPRGGMCPYANLLVAQALAESPAGTTSDAAMLAAQAVLGHWDIRHEKRPFLFGMGTDFAKLKFPMVWYNILHVLSVLMNIKGMAEDPRCVEMLNIVRGKLDESGRATAESIYMIYKGHEWSDKKNPSRLITILVHRILQQQP